MKGLIQFLIPKKHIKFKCTYQNKTHTFMCIFNCAQFRYIYLTIETVYKLIGKIFLFLSTLFINNIFYYTAYIKATDYIPTIYWQ